MITGRHYYDSLYKQVRDNKRNRANRLAKVCLCCFFEKELQSVAIFRNSFIFVNVWTQRTLRSAKSAKKFTTDNLSVLCASQRSLRPKISAQFVSKQSQ